MAASIQRGSRKTVGISSGVVVLALGLTALWCWHTDELLAVLPRSEAAVLSDERDEVRTGRLFRHVTLVDERLGPINFTVSLPDPLPGSRLPLVVVLGGAGTGENSIRFVDAAGDNAIVGYDWPLPATFPKGIRALEELPSMRRHALSVPGQIAAMLRWLISQPWSDVQRVSVLGFSLGALAAPAAERVSEEEGINIRWTVLAYGGAGFDSLIAADQRIRPAWLRPILGFGAELLLRPLEPAAHLPHLNGHFLVLGAAHDTIVQSQASAKLEALTPQPKTIIHTEGDHIGTGSDRRELFANAMAATRLWLISEGAVNSGSGTTREN
jgi:dienelactone hydrolase